MYNGKIKHLIQNLQLNDLFSGWEGKSNNMTECKK